MIDPDKEYDVIVVGAGVIGPAIAVGMARHGRNVLLLERDLSEPDRIVGELLQPGGVQALKHLGMAAALENINAMPIYGYDVIYQGESVLIPYPQIDSKGSITAGSNSSEAATGCGFHHGGFIMNMRRIASQTPGVTLAKALVTDVVTNESTGHVLGVQAKVGDEEISTPIYAKIVIMCDGIMSNFRKRFVSQQPVVESYFVGSILKNPSLPAPNHGHVIIGPTHKPLLIYQISPTEARILCAVPAPLPSVASGALKQYLKDHCLPNLPLSLQPTFQRAIESEKLRSMPNQYLPAKNIFIPGLMLIGDALNMRHPLTGGGMTVGLNDALLLTNLIGPRKGRDAVDLSDYEVVKKKLYQFYKQRKGISSVVNVLSVALYSLFSADKPELRILQRGCFEYFRRGGDCVEGPVSLLSGLLPRPAKLIYHFFAVAFYSIWLNFRVKGFSEFPAALYQMFSTLYTAVVVFVPFLIKELINS